MDPVPFPRVQAGWRRLPLAAQLFLATSSAIGVVFAASFIYDLSASTRRLESLQRDALHAMSSVLADAVERAMIHENRRHIDELFRQLNSDRRVTVTLLDNRGRLVDTGNFGAPRRPAGEQGTGLAVDRPLVSKPECLRCHATAAAGPIGTLRIAARRDERGAFQREHIRSRATMAASGALLLGLASLLIARRLVQGPLSVLALAMQRVRRGELDARIDVPLPGEISQIADGFNAMVAGIERDRREILELHRKGLAHVDRLASLGELAAHLAHEVRNPLTGLSSTLQLILQDGAPASARADILPKMLAQLNRMDRAMGNFLAYARMPEPVFQPFDINEPISRALFLLEARLHSQDIRLERRTAEGLPRLQGDPAQLQQVFLNLLLNAAQAAPRGGRIGLTTERSDRGEVIVTISDDGPGISPENLERVFQPFFTTRENGSGLGLPISKQIVLAHAGELELESVPGAGTTARVRLPARAAAEATPA